MTGDWLEKWRWYISLREDLRLWNSIRKYFPADLSWPCTFYCTCKHSICLQYHITLFMVAKFNLTQLGVNFWLIFFLINVSFWHSHPLQRNKESWSFKSKLLFEGNIIIKNQTQTVVSVSLKLCELYLINHLCDATENTLCYFLCTLFVKLCLLTCYCLANY